MRTPVRPSQLRAAGRRFNSSTPSPSQNPQVQRAVEGAQKAYEQTSAAVTKVAGPLGQRLGNALGSYREPIAFNFKVFTSLCRQVYRAEKLAPPLELSQWASAYSHIYSRAVSMRWWGDIFKNGTWATVAVIGAEAYGIFCIGEMIGRRNVVGYKLEE